MIKCNLNSYIKKEYYFILIKINFYVIMKRKKIADYY